MSWQPGVYYVQLLREFNLKKNYAQAESLKQPNCLERDKKKYVFYLLWNK